MSPVRKCLLSRYQGLSHRDSQQLASLLQAGLALGTSLSSAAAALLDHHQALENLQQGRANAKYREWHSSLYLFLTPSHMRPSGSPRVSRDMGQGGDLLQSSHSRSPLYTLCQELCAPFSFLSHTSNGLPGPWPPAPPPSPLAPCPTPSPWPPPPSPLPPLQSPGSQPQDSLVLAPSTPRQCLFRSPAPTRSLLHLCPPWLSFKFL